MMWLRPDDLLQRALSILLSQWLNPEAKVMNVSSCGRAAIMSQTSVCVQTILCLKFHLVCLKKWIRTSVFFFSFFEGWGVEGYLV